MHWRQGVLLVTLISVGCTESRDPREPPELPESFAASASREELTYFFVHEGVCQTFTEKEDSWRPVDERVP